MILNPWNVAVLNAFRHQRLKNRWALRVRWSHICAQRLSASEVEELLIDSYRLTKGIMSLVVLNAFRHQRLKNAIAIALTVFNPTCSCQNAVVERGKRQRAIGDQSQLNCLVQMLEKFAGRSGSGLVEAGQRSRYYPDRF